MTATLQHTSTRLRTERYRKTIRSNDGHVCMGGPRLLDVPCGNAAPHRHHTTHFPQRPAPLGRSCSKNNNTVRRWHSPHRCLQRLLQHRGTLLTGAENGKGQALDPASGSATIAMPTSHAGATKPQPNVDIVKLFGGSEEVGHYSDQSFTSAKWLNSSASHGSPLKHKVGRTSRCV